MKRTHVYIYSTGFVHIGGWTGAWRIYHPGPSSMERLFFLLRRVSLECGDGFVTGFPLRLPNGLMRFEYWRVS
jgi:hypothetical protein